MKNWEKYINELYDIDTIHFGVANKQIYRCIDIKCRECDFGGDEKECKYSRFDWLCEEAKPTLTKHERAFCYGLDTGWELYIVRNSSGALRLFSEKPEKGNIHWDNYCNLSISLNPNLFSFIRWEDEEPWKLSDLLKLEVE